jgi:hypothetical protein
MKFVEKIIIFKNKMFTYIDIPERIPTYSLEISILTFDETNALLKEHIQNKFVQSDMIKINFIRRALKALLY